jgi:hypothetical protein
VRPFHFDRTWPFDLPAAALWDVLNQTDEFPIWWTWLREFRADGGLESGTTAHCVVKAPLPYSLRLDVRIDTVRPAELLTATVTGDLSGRARLEVTDHADGRCSARLVWSVEVCEPRMRTAARLARPVFEWGHEWVVNTGVAQFRRRALRVPPG